jgi:hypothetical protein
MKSETAAFLDNARALLDQADTTLGVSLTDAAGRTAVYGRAACGAAIPRIEAFGRKGPSPLVSSDRGGAISIPTQDPYAVRAGGGQHL